MRQVSRPTSSHRSKQSIEHRARRSRNGGPPPNKAVQLTGSALPFLGVVPFDVFWCSSRGGRSPTAAERRSVRLHSSIDVTPQVSPYVREKLSEALPSDDAKAAISSLEAAVPIDQRGSLLERRVHLAIVKLTCDPWNSSDPEPNRIDRFCEAFELAKIDWRDLLVAAGLENDDWPEVLVASGYQPPAAPPIGAPCGQPLDGGA